MTIHFTIKPITEWLAISAVCVFVFGIILSYITAAALEIGSFIFAGIGFWVAVVLLILAAGSML